MAWIGAVINIAGQVISGLGSSGGPSYPSPPKLSKIPIEKAAKFMNEYETKRMAASIDAWKQRFPLLYQGGSYLINDIRRNQQGKMSNIVQGALRASGLGQIKGQGDQYQLAQEIGLSPITLSQRTSQAVTRAMALDNEWTSKISGGALASMMANNYQNQNAFTQFLGNVDAANYAAQQKQAGANTAALFAGLGGAARLGMQAYQNYQMGSLNPSTYLQGQQLAQSNAYNYPQQTMNVGANGGTTYGNTNLWNQGVPAPTMWGSPYGGTYSNIYSPFGGFGGGPVNWDTGASYETSNVPPVDLWNASTGGLGF